MTSLLAFDTATDALTMALQAGGERRQLHRVLPRQQQQQFFGCLQELLGGTSPAELALDAIAFGAGPGSFTGLRIAASAAQGLGYSLQLPVVSVSTLETQACTLLRTQGISEPCTILSTLDARLGEIYLAWYAYDGETLRALTPATVTRPAAITAPGGCTGSILGAGSGLRYRDEIGDALAGLGQCWPELLPEARDMIDPAARALGAGLGRPPQEAIPDYLSDRSGWKTLAEQGRA